MKITVPVDSAKEATILIDAGAGALYCGYIPDTWLEKHSHLESFNRRTFAEAQITSKEEISAVVRAAEKKKVPVLVTFNASYYPKWMYEPVIETIRELGKLGVSGFIISDLSLILMLKKEGIGGLALSTMGGVFNSRAAGFYSRLGVERISLPRELNTSQIAAVAKANPGISFDVFILFGACANAETFCRWFHDDSRRVWPCVKKYHPDNSWSAKEKKDKAVSAQLGWGGLSRVWACGLCSLYDLRSNKNVDGLKIVGRGAPIDRKIAGVSMLRSLIESLGRGTGRECFMAESRGQIVRYSDGGCNPYLCYFPEYL